ncbi:MAG: GNAT family N-acetyltransferase [Chlamydiae bacterium]|nr:GNAT family N-acetyltransferase [Chlamydiota bacterium]
MEHDPNFDIRYSEIKDFSYVKEWICEPQISKWFPMSTVKEVEDVLACWMGFCRLKSSLTATIDGIPCGVVTLFLMPYKKVCHHCIFKLVVNPKYHRRGIGSSLVKNAKHLAKDYFRLERLQIEVMEHNPLISLLKKQDFQEVMSQSKYFKIADTYQGRVLMEAKLVK